MREITTHHDGHGLMESIHIKADEPGPGGASHVYTLSVDLVKDGSATLLLGDIVFQKGPRNVAGSTPGILDSVLLAIVRDRLAYFQAGGYPCVENQRALERVIDAMNWLETRAHQRSERGVLGTNEK